MNNAYRITQELLKKRKKFEYGNHEETIGFVFDNFYTGLDMLRTCIKFEKDVEKIKKQAHEELKKLRDDESRWRRLGVTPKDFDATEHQKRKDYLAALREYNPDILYYGEPLKEDALGNIVLKINNLTKFFMYIWRC